MIINGFPLFRELLYCLKFRLCSFHVLFFYSDFVERGLSSFYVSFYHCIVSLCNFRGVHQLILN